MRNIKGKIGAYIIALALVGTLVPVLGGVKEDKSVATGDNVAKIGETEYATLQEAVAAAGIDPTTIELIKNVTSDAQVMNVPSGAKITLDLGNYSITSNGAVDTIQVASTGRLTIEGSGTVSNTSSNAEASAVRCEPGATLTIEGGTYETTDKGAALECAGNVQLNDGVYEDYILVYKSTTGGDRHLLVEGGKFKSYFRPVTEATGDSDATAMNGSVTINGGKFSVIKTQLVQGHTGDSKVGALQEVTDYESIWGTGVVLSSQPLDDGYYLAHVHDKKVVLEGKAATCTEKGKTEGNKCSLCNEVQTEQEDIPALGHDMSDLIDAKAPTRHETGYYAHYECKRCGNYFKDSAGKEPLTKESVVIPALISVTSGIATIDDSIIDDAITAFKGKNDEDKYVELLFTDVEKTVTTFKLPTQGIRKITNEIEEPKVMIILPSGAIVAFFKDTLNGMVAASGNDEYIDLTVKPTHVKDMTEKQQVAIKLLGDNKLNVEMVITASIKCNGNYYSDFGEDTVVIFLPYEMKDNLEYGIVHISEEGKVEEIYSETGDIEGATYIALGTNHFSEFAVVSTESGTTGGTSGGTSGGTTGGTSGTTSGSSSAGASTSGKVQNVPTGDEANMVPWICILVGSIISITVVGIYAKKKKIW